MPPPLLHRRRSDGEPTWPDIDRREGPIDVLVDRRKPKHSHDQDDILFMFEMDRKLDEKDD